MKNLLLICGYSFSGKSTLVNKIAQKLPDSRIISLDKINEERGLDISGDISHDDWEQTHQIAIDKIKSSVDRYLLIDDTNMFKKHRFRFAEAGTSAGYVPITIFVDTPTEIVRERYLDLKKAARHVPPKEAFEFVIKNFEKPTTEENHIIYEYGSDFNNLMSELQDRLK